MRKGDIREMKLHAKTGCRYCLHQIGNEVVGAGANKDVIWRGEVETGWKRGKGNGNQ